MSSDLFSRHLMPQVRRLESHGMVATAPSPFRSLESRIFIACTSRTGGTLLCELLRRYGLAGGEWLNFANVVEKGLSLDDYLAGLARSAPNGRFCVKGVLNALAPLAMVGEVPEHVHSWEFAFLTRRDLVRQAVSLLIAELTGAWDSASRPRMEVRECDYDGARLAGLLEQIQTSNGIWEHFFSVTGIRPVRLCYEDLAADQAAATATLAEAFRLPEFDLSIQPRIKRQSTAINDAWAERFRAEAMAFRVK